MELIDLINDLENFRNKGFRDCNVEKIILKLKKIENGKKVKIPEFVADYIKYAKENDWDLQDSMNLVTDEDNRDLHIWFFKGDNIEVFARAWLDGYEIKQEKRYLVKMKGVAGYGRYLNKALSSGEYFFASENEVGLYKTKHTKKELENSGFGWVFDCPGIEIKEVK